MSLLVTTVACKPHLVLRFIEYPDLAALLALLTFATLLAARRWTLVLQDNLEAAMVLCVFIPLLEMLPLLVADLGTCIFRVLHGVQMLAITVMPQHTRPLAAS